MKYCLTVLVAISAILLCACSMRHGSSRSEVTSMQDVCRLSKHPNIYANKEIRLTTVFLNAPPHGMALYEEGCSVPIIKIGFSKQFEHQGRKELYEKINTYLADQAITMFKITVIGHIGYKSGVSRFYFDRIVSLKPDQTVIVK